MHEHIAFRTAYAIVGSAADAEEVTQEAFVKAYNALPRFRTGSPFRPWLLRIVANEARNRRRTLGRRAHLLSRAADEAASGDPARSPEARAATPSAATSCSPRSHGFEGRRAHRDRRALLHRTLGRGDGRRARGSPRRREDARSPRARAPASRAGGGRCVARTAPRGCRAVLRVPGDAGPAGVARAHLPERRPRSRTRIALAFAVVLALVAGAVLALSPGARSAVADLFDRIPGIHLERRVSLPVTRFNDPPYRHRDRPRSSARTLRSAAALPGGPRRARPCLRAPRSAWGHGHRDLRRGRAPRRARLQPVEDGWAHALLQGARRR